MDLRSSLRILDPRWKPCPDRLTGPLRNRVFSMSWSTGGMMTPGNVDATYHALNNIGDVEGHLLEIGCFCGLSSNLITLLKRACGVSKLLFAVDPWVYGPTEARHETFTDFTTVTWDEYQTFVREAYRSRVGFFSRDDLPHAVRHFSDGGLSL